MFRWGNGGESFVCTFVCFTIISSNFKFITLFFLRQKGEEIPRFSCWFDLLDLYKNDLFVSKKIYFNRRPLWCFFYLFFISPTLLFSVINYYYYYHHSNKKRKKNFRRSEERIIKIKKKEEEEEEDAAFLNLRKS